MWRSFRVRILMAMLAIALASIGLLFGVSYRSAVRTLEHNYLLASVENTGTKINRFDEYMSDLYQGAVRAGVNTELQETVTAYLALEHPRTDDIIALSTLLKEFCGSSDTIETVYLYLPDKHEMLTSDELHQRRTGISPEQYPWTQTAAGFAPVRFSDAMSGSSHVMYGYGKPLLDKTGRTFAVVCTGISAQTLRYSIFQDSGSAYYFLLNGTESILVNMQLEDNSPPELSPSTAESLSYADIVYSASGDWLYVSVQAPFSGLRLLRLTERDTLRGEMVSVREQFLLLLLLVMLLALLLAWVLGRWLYRPMGSLMAAMAKVGSGDLSPCAEPEQPEEFSQLSRCFNQMIMEINGLIDDLVNERTAKAEAELKALQYQIQPHFMYNTLNSIKYAAILQGNPKIGEQIGAFIELLEASISKKGALVTLTEEIQLLESYVSLQSYRYMDCFTVDYDMTEETAGCYVPRLLLQPIVENSILHGMDVKRGDNRIRVAALVTEGSLWLTVQDNGKGMPQEQLQQMLLDSTDSHRQFTGIGIANIRERLRLYYGTQADFHVYSRLGEGTKFVLRLPASYEEEEYSR